MKTTLWATLTANGNYAQSSPDNPPKKRWKTSRHKQKQQEISLSDVRRFRKCQTQAESPKRNRKTRKVLSRGSTSLYCLRTLRTFPA